MKRPSVVHGVLWSFVAALLVGVCWWLLPIVTHFGLRVVLVSLLLGYLVHLMRTLGSRVGAATLLALNGVAGLAAAFFLPLSLEALVLLLAVFLSLTRTLLMHRRLSAVALDAAINCAGLLFAGYLLTQTRNLAAGVWGYFLVQSAAALIPSNTEESESAPVEKPGDRFADNLRRAEAALDRIISA